MFSISNAPLSLVRLRAVQCMGSSLSTASFSSSKRSVCAPKLKTFAKRLTRVDSNAHLKFYEASFHARMLSSSRSYLNVQSRDKEKESVKEELSKQEAESPETSNPTPSNDSLSKRERLKILVRDYGATVIVFHVTMSLASLGIFYLLVSSGLDVIGILEKIGISGESMTYRKVTEEASKFVVAYAIHKVFAPIRISITIGATPLIVRKLRSMGILKQATKQN